MSNVVPFDNGEGYIPLTIPLPPRLKHYAPELEHFFNGMVFKLAVNAHKDTPTRPQVPELIGGLMREMGELMEQIARDRFDPNSLQECFDTSNYAFLVYLALLRDGVGKEIPCD
jgi:hypothetical protein